MKNLCISAEKLTLCDVTVVWALAIVFMHAMVIVYSCVGQMLLIAVQHSIIILLRYYNLNQHNLYDIKLKVSLLLCCLTCVHVEDSWLHTTLTDGHPAKTLPVRTVITNTSIVSLVETSCFCKIRSRCTHAAI